MTHIVYVLSGGRAEPVFIDKTADIRHRMLLHRIEGYRGQTVSPGGVRLVYFESLSGPGSAQARLKALKDKAPIEICRIVDAQNPDWRDLWHDWFAARRRI